MLNVLLQVAVEEMSLMELSKSHFRLCPSFPLVPLSQSDTQSLPQHFLARTPPDVTRSNPIPGVRGSFFIFSSLSPKPVSSSGVSRNPPKSLKVKNVKNKNKTKVKNKTKKATFEKKVLKSKLISANLQKQRIRNNERFKSLMQNVDGIYKCRLCDKETVLRSKAWNHSSRCGLKKKKKDPKQKSHACKTCTQSFQSKRKLHQHFRVEHQMVKFICVECPSPVTFKYKNSIRRHHALKHKKLGIGSSFNCDWCHFKATTRFNLKRHVGRIHKITLMVSSLLDTVVESAVSATIIPASVTNDAVNELCEYEKIRQENIREKELVFRSLFPEKVKPAKTAGKKKSVKKSPEQSRKSSRVTVCLLNERAGSSSSSGGLGETVKNQECSPSSGVEQEDTSKKFNCSICSFKTNHRHSLDRHLKKKHEELDENILCSRSFCSLSFTTRSDKEKHTLECWLTCPREQCTGKRFSRPDKFKQHIRMHTVMDKKMY